MQSFFQKKLSLTHEPNFLHKKVFSKGESTCKNPSSLRILYFIKPQQTEKPGPDVFSARPFILIGFPILTLIPKKSEVRLLKPFNSDDFPV